MSDIFICEIEKLEKQGVKVIKIEKEYRKNGENHTTIEVTRELDFSEHDKVFEDKIAKLENQIDRLNEEKSFLRTRCMPYVEKDFDKRLYGKLSIVSCNEEFVDIQKYADGDDLYSIEVRNLISEGGVKRLIGQYRNLSSRLDKISDENKELKQITKGYEDKIAELKKDYKTASELLGKYQQENESLKKRVVELENFSCQAEQETESLVEKLKQRIAELESGKTSELPFDALETANYLINATYERETSSLERAFAKVPDKVNSDRYTIDDLEQIAEHLLVYCKHNKESEE